MKAVIDRIVGNIAVILFEEQNLEINVPVELLPKNIKEGTWLNINFSVDDNYTAEMYRKNKELLEKIKRKNIK